MPPRTSATSALDRLAELDAAVEAARANVAAREREADERRRELTRLRTERAEYERAVGRGADPDPELEARLDAALRAPGLEEVERTPYGVPAYRELVDRRAEARIAGAAEAREEAEDERRRFSRANLSDLHAEAAAGADEEREAVLDALRALAAALEPTRERQLAVGRIFGLAGQRGGGPPDPYEDLDLRRVVERARRSL